MEKNQALLQKQAERERENLRKIRQILQEQKMQEEQRQSQSKQVEYKFDQEQNDASRYYRKLDFPKGWEMRLDRNKNRVYFLNHNTKTTTWNDPRGSIEITPEIRDFIEKKQFDEQVKQFDEEHKLENMNLRKKDRENRENRKNTPRRVKPKKQVQFS
jgi:hypothetical protein